MHSSMCILAHKMVDNKKLYCAMHCGTSQRYMLLLQAQNAGECKRKKSAGQQRDLFQYF